MAQKPADVHQQVETVLARPPAADTREPARLADYVSIARPDHWIKHVFILPGIVLAVALLPDVQYGSLPLKIAIGLVAAALIASSNYVINEWLDAPSDRHHPLKGSRPAVARRMSPQIVYLEYVGLAATGVLLGWLVSPLFLITCLAFLLSGVVYNVRPMRTKDRLYLDVISESINNPIRFVLGWAMVDPLTLPPSSLLLTYWMGGAFLMVVKRLAEYRHFEATGRLDELRLYRASFRMYDAERLLLSAFVYSQLSAFFIAVFLVKYRIEYLLTLPIFSALFAVYFKIGLKSESPAQAPEHLFKERVLVVTVVALVLSLIVLTFIDVPWIAKLADPHYLTLPR